MKVLAAILIAQIFYSEADWNRFLEGQRQAAAAAAWQREVDYYNEMRRREREAWAEIDRLNEKDKEYERELREIEENR